MGADKNRLNEAVLLSTFTFFFCTHLSIYLSIHFVHIHVFIYIFLFMCELFTFCNVEMVAIYAVLAVDDVTSFDITPT